MQVIVDSREKQRVDHALIYYQDKGYTATVETLEYGDYLFEDKVVFEFKLIRDYMQSLYNESLFEEATNQAIIYPYHYVIIVGNLTEYLNEQWVYARSKWKGNFENYIKYHYKTFNGSLRRLRSFTCPIIIDKELGLQKDHNTHQKLVKEACEKAYLEMSLQASKCLDQTYYGGTKRAVHTGNVVTHTLCGAGGVSNKTSQRIKEELQIHTMEDLINTTLEEFQTVKGVGEKTSQNLIDWIHQKQ